MSFQLMNDDVQIISKLGDEPNEDDGLDAAGLKAKFDEAATLLKAAHNTLVAALNAVNAAESVGFDSDDIDGANVKAAMENLRSDLVTQMQSITQGGVAEGGIQTAMLAANAVTGAKVAAGTLRDDINGSTVMQLRRSEFTSITNNLKLHYFRSLGLVFVEGTVEVVPSSANNSASLVFSYYAPDYLDYNWRYLLFTDNGDFRQASIISLNGEVELNVTVKNVSAGVSMIIPVYGWYLCNGEGS